MEVNDIYEVKMYGYAIDQVSVNVLHYKITTKGGTGATEQQLADYFSNLGSTYWKPLMSSSSDWKGAAVRRLVPGPFGSIVTSSLGTGAGGVSGDMLPRQVCGVGTLRTAVGGRAGRGRIYFPFPGETDNFSTSTPTAGYIANMAAALSNIITGSTGTGGNTNGFRLGVFHRSTNGIDDVISGFARNTWGTQRRRGSYGHRNTAPSL